ncbi:MAG: hypothetical protein AB2810_19330 [Candidatus Thiodiazotropha endolucinida]
MFPGPDTSLYLFGLMLFLGLAVVAMYGVNSPKWLLIAGIGITAFGSFLGYDIGSISSNLKFAEGLSQSFIVFISVLGGGIVSSACSEMRQKRRAKFESSDSAR